MPPTILSTEKPEENMDADQKPDAGQKPDADGKPNETLGDLAKKSCRTRSWRTIVTL